MSAQDLADRCAELGAPMQRSVIANFESGRRSSIGVSEVFVLAAALKIPPVWLITGVGYEETVEFLPGEYTDPYVCSQWIYGTHSQDGEEEEYGENPMTFLDDLLFAAYQLLDLLKKIEEVESVVSLEAQAPEGLKSQYLELEGQFRVEAQRMEELMARAAKRDEAGEAAEGSPEAQEVVRQRDEAVANMMAMRRKLDALIERQAARDALTELGYLRGELALSENEMRKVLANFRERGWRLPVLPEELQYLLRETEPKTKRPMRPRK